MQDIFGRSEFIGQALLALTELTHDGEPMGFDLTLQIARSRHIKARGGKGGNASIGIEVMYNPLESGA